MVFKNRLGNLGLWETMQTMEDVTKKIGWESAAILTQRKAIDKRLKK